MIGSYSQKFVERNGGGGRSRLGGGGCGAVTQRPPGAVIGLGDQRAAVDGDRRLSARELVDHG